MRKGKFLFSLMATTLVLCSNAQIPVKLESFNVSDVTLTESAFKHAEDMDIQYLMAIDPVLDTPYCHLLKRIAM